MTLVLVCMYVVPQAGIRLPGRARFPNPTYDQMKRCDDVVHALSAVCTGRMPYGRTDDGGPHRYIEILIASTRPCFLIDAVKFGSSLFFFQY